MPYKGTRGSEWSDANVLCPCFKAANVKAKTMVCEGAAAGSTIMFSLKHPEGFRLFRKRYCERDFRACPYYRAVEERYFAKEGMEVPCFGNGSRGAARC